MKKLLAILLCFIMVTVSVPALFVCAEGGMTYYVSPDGDDLNAGTEESPWKTLYKAARTLQPGDTAIFENGVYEETKITSFANAGSEDAPITIKARNTATEVDYNNYPEEQTAVIKYVGLSDSCKLAVLVDYVNVEGFYFTQDSMGTSTNDIYVDVRNADGCNVLNNVCTEVFEEGIKARNLSKINISGNVILYPVHEGLDVFGCADSIISNNTVIEAGRTGIMVKGNSRNCLIYNNSVINREIPTMHGYTIGGQSGGTDVHINTENEGYEAYNLVAYNNIAYSADHLMKNGYSFLGAKDCYSFNNIAYGSETGFLFSDPSDDKVGWPWDPITENPVLYNNIIAGTKRAYNVVDTTIGLVSDYNCYFNNESAPVYDKNKSTNELNSIWLDPMFENVEEGDFRLRQGSPARSWAGYQLPATVPGYKGFDDVEGETEGKTLAIPQIDFNGEERQKPYTIGVFNLGESKSFDVLSEDYEAYPFTKVNREEYETDTDFMEAHSSANPIMKKGWSNYVQNTVTLSDNRITVKKDEETGNQYASILRTKQTTSAGSALYYVYKPFEKPVSMGKMSLQLKVMRAHAGGWKFMMHAINKTGGVAADYITDFSISQTLGSAYFSETGTAMQAPVGKWYDIEYVFDFDNNKAYTYLDGELISSASGWSFTLANINAFSITSHRFQGATEAMGEFAVDDMYVSVIGKPDVREIKPLSQELATKLGIENDLKYAEIIFSNNINKATLSSGRIVLDGAVQSKPLVPVNGSKKHFLVEFDEALTPGFVDYDITFDSLSDLYGESLENVGAVLTTRERHLNIDDIKFYSEYTETVKTQMSSLNELKDGSVTAAFDVLNEKTDPIDAALIIVHKSGGKIKNVRVCNAAVRAEETTDKYISVTGVSKEDTVEAYLWDGIKTMRPIADAALIDSEGTQSKKADAEKIIDSLDVTVNILNVPETDDMKMSVSGESSQEGEAVTAYVLKPGYKLKDLTFDNFSAAVDFVGQTVSQQGGRYSFDYTVTDGQNGKTYNAYAGGISEDNPAEDSVIFFDNKFVGKIVEAVNKADAQQLADMLSEKIYVPGVGSDVYLNSLLKLDLADYNKLKDYTATENFKEQVAEALEKGEFSGTAEIIECFRLSVKEQTENQKNYLALLASVNSSAWSKLEGLFGDNKEMLQLPWEESYKSIKNNSGLKETFYKKLANEYKFKDFDELRAAFENEAKKLKPKEPTGSGGGGGGGGGGSKDVKYSSSLNTTNIAETEKTAEEEKKIEFTDIDTVPWAEEAIKTLTESGILSGIGNNKFAPGQNVTREQFVKMVVLSFDLYDENAEAKQFIDIGINTWYEKYIASAVNCGIIYGMDEEHFGVGKEITRSEMTAILYRVCKYKGIELKEVNKNITYSDKNEIPAYAYESVMKISGAGIMNGVGEGRFAPNDKATRAMAARVLWLLRGEK